LRFGDDELECVQHMYMRVAVAVHGRDTDLVLDAYTMMSRGVYVHASPTMFNAGRINAQLSSCFILDVDTSDVGTVFDAVRDAAVISSSCGGLGVALHMVPSDRWVASSGSVGGNVIALAKIFQATARYASQGGVRRPGATTIYLEVWHANILEFIRLKALRGPEEMRARDLFYGLWICDEFMERVRDGGMWTLFCPTQVPMLSSTYGGEFVKLYRHYESRGLGEKEIPARELWMQVLTSQSETGGPFMLYKDAVNRKSNQQNLGVICSSNLCTEITQYTSPDETATCNLASINVSKFLTDDGTVDYDRLLAVAKFVASSLNCVIDRTYYPTKKARRSNLAHRPMGIGFQGLADLFAVLRIPYDSVEARAINIRIYETLYKGALEASSALAAFWGSYSTFEGSPASRGILSFDMWNVTPSDQWDWEEVRKMVKDNGLRNALLVAQMPTASTSMILGVSESVDPYISNVFSRKGVFGEYPLINRHLVLDLVRIGMWTEDIRTQLLRDDGSVQNILGIPLSLKMVYKTAWEIKQKTLLDLAIDRAPFICQSQSTVIYYQLPSLTYLSRMHFYGWKRGLKTGMYYLRSRAGTRPDPFHLPVLSVSDSTFGGYSDVPPLEQLSEFVSPVSSVSDGDGDVHDIGHVAGADDERDASSVVEPDEGDGVDTSVGDGSSGIGTDGETGGDAIASGMGEGEGDTDLEDTEEEGRPPAVGRRSVFGYGVQISDFCESCSS
ncbi:hypothetical protein K474DRAFT_1600129, partial [Panus rudis PR-1116 ss-1]